MNNQVNEQDWNQVIWYNKKREKENAQRAGNITTLSKISQLNKEAAAKLKKLDNPEGGIPKLKYIDGPILDCIKKTCNKNVPTITQKDLGDKSGLGVHKIKEIWGGNHLYDPNVLKKIENVLKVKLTGKNLGEPTFINKKIEHSRISNK